MRPLRLEESPVANFGSLQRILDPLAFDDVALLRLLSLPEGRFANRSSSSPGAPQGGILCYEVDSFGWHLNPQARVCPSAIRRSWTNYIKSRYVIITCPQDADDGGDCSNSFRRSHRAGVEHFARPTEEFPACLSNVSNGPRGLEDAHLIHLRFRKGRGSSGHLGAPLPVDHATVTSLNRSLT